MTARIVRCKGLDMVSTRCKACKRTVEDEGSIPSESTYRG